MSIEDWKDATWDDRRTLRARTRVREEAVLTLPLPSPLPRPVTSSPVVSALEAELALRTRQLAEAQAQLALSERLASLGVLAAGVGHDLSNPLAYITANLSFLRAEMARGLSGPQMPTAERPAVSRAELLEAVDDALQGAAKVRAIVGELKTWAVEGGEALQAVDVQHAIESAFGLATQAGPPRCLVRYAFGATQRAAAHEGRLGQVLVHLITQALQSFPAERDPAQNELRLSSANGPGVIVIDIADNGRALGPDSLGAAFDACRELVHKMNGNLSLHGTRGEGTRVRIVLPLAASSLPARRALRQA